MPGATNPPFLGEKCWGVDLRTKPLNEIWLNGCDVSYLADAYQMAKSAGKTAEFWGKSWGNSRFWSDLLSGSSKLREQITGGVPAERIKAGWQSDIARFKKQRKPYLLYEEIDKAIETL